MAVNQRKAAVMLSYATQFVKILSALLYTPLMLRILGQSEYGTYQLVNSIVAYLSLFSLGFASSYTRFYMRYAVDGDEEGIARLNGMFLATFTAMAAIAGSCGCVMAENIRGLLGTGLTAHEYGIAAILMKYMVFNLILSFFSSVFDCIITAHERFILQKAVSFLQSLLSPLVALPLLFLGAGSIGLVIVSTGLSVVKFLVSVTFCLKGLQVKFSVKGLCFPLLKEIWGFTFFIFLNQVIDQVMWNLDKFLLGRICGTVQVAVYGMAGQLNGMYLEFSGAVSGPFTPAVNRIAMAGGDGGELDRLFVKVGRAQALLLFLVISGYLFFGKAFIVLWGGLEYEAAYYVGLFLMVPVTAALIQNLGIEIQRAKNRHQARSVIYLAIAVGNALVSIPLIKAYGAVGAAAGTAIAYIPGTILFMNFYYHCALGLDIPAFWKQIGKVAASVSPAFGLGLLIWRFVDIESWEKMVCVALAYSAAYCACAYRWGMNREERSQVWTALGKFGIKH